MWDYCIYLGPFTSKSGENYDLGAWCRDKDSKEFSGAVVYGDTPGDYMSGELSMFNRNKDHEIYNEVEKRLRALNLID